MVFGYARESTKGQSIDRQIDALTASGCEEIFQDKISSREKESPQLNQLLARLRKDDILIVDRMDRLGKTAKQLINLIHHFKERGIQFKSLKETLFDTTTPMGDTVLQIIAILKAMEVEVLRERTLVGIKAARARGRNGGRKSGTFNKEKAALAASLYKDEKQHSISKILKMTGIKSKSTLYIYLRKEKVLN